MGDLRPGRRQDGSTDVTAGHAQRGLQSHESWKLRFSCQNKCREDVLWGVIWVSRGQMLQLSAAFRACASREHVGSRCLAVWKRRAWPPLSRVSCPTASRTWTLQRKTEGQQACATQTDVAEPRERRPQHVRFQGETLTKICRLGS